MKVLLLTGFAFVWLAAAQAEESKPVAATVGKEFKITLQCNPTTGYQWVLAKAPDEKLAKLLRSEFKRPNSKLVGVGGEMRWTFQALAEGQTQMELNYIRLWEKGVKPAQTTNFVIVIKAKKAPAKAEAPAPGT
jgi:inhibitor of cysteine peptidase